MHFRLFFVAICVMFAGCTFPREPSSGCEPTKTSGSTLYFKGLEIPTGVSVPVKIGELRFGPEQVAALTDSVLVIESSRIKQCISYNALLKAVPPANADQILAMQKEGSRIELEANRLFFAFKIGGADAASVLAAAKTGSEQSKLASDKAEVIEKTVNKLPGASSLAAPEWLPSEKMICLKGLILVCRRCCIDCSWCTCIAK